MPCTDEQVCIIYHVVWFSGLIKRVQKTRRQKAEMLTERLTEAETKMRT